MVATKEEILKARHANFEDVEVEDWGKIKIRIRALSAAETFEYMDKLKESREDETKAYDDSMIWAFMKTAVDENFKNLFDAESETDIAQVKELPFHGFLFLQNKIIAMNKLGEESSGDDIDTAKEVAKNESGETDGQNLPSDSP